VLLAEDEDARRRLAKSAAEGGWSVRVLEDRARKANEVRVSRGPDRPELHPDQLAACAEIAETLSAALGREVKVRPRGTEYKVEFTVAGQDQAEALAARLGDGAIA
jgi:ParB family chromosome partitioning protein